MTILAGDFNAKVGKRRHTDISCLGKFLVAEQIIVGTL